MAVVAVNRFGFDYEPERLGSWLVALSWSVVVCALHFGGLHYDIYTRIWWWDLLTHSASGAGVAAVFYLFRPGALRSRLGLFVVVPAFVLGVGAGFELYEYAFKDFWWHWSQSFYVRDTGLDLGMDVLGAYLFIAVVRLRARLFGRRQSSD